MKQALLVDSLLVDERRSWCLCVSLAESDGRMREKRLPFPREGSPRRDVTPHIRLSSTHLSKHRQHRRSDRRQKDSESLSERN